MEPVGLIVFIILLGGLFKWMKPSKKTEFDKGNIDPKNDIKSNIPTEILEREFDKLIDSFVEGEHGKNFQSSLMLKRGEKLIFDVPDISLCEERSVKVKGTYQGFSIRIMKGVSYRFGGFQGGTEKQVVELDKGNFILSNKRLVFSGETTSKEIPLSKINTIEPLDHGIQLTRSGKQKTEYYIGTDNVKLDLTISPSEGEDFDEEKISWELSGLEVKNMIQKLLQE